MIEQVKDLESDAKAGCFPEIGVFHDRKTAIPNLKERQLMRFSKFHALKNVEF